MDDWQRRKEPYLTFRQADRKAGARIWKQATEASESKASGM